MTKKEKDDLFAARLPGVLQYHQLMLSDGVRNKLLYEAIKSCVTAETRFLDVGAGTGVWAILAAKLGAKRVVAVEIEECLIPIIYKHARENGVADKIEIIHANIDDVKMRGKFDVIVSELFGNDAFGEATVNSFIKLRNKYLAPGGVLIPQKLSMFAAPVKIHNPIQAITAEVSISCSFLKSIKLNYPQSLFFSEKDKVTLLATPETLIEIDFSNIQTKLPLDNLSADWSLDNLSEANAFLVFNISTFTDDLRMEGLTSKSWSSGIYEFQPYQQKAGKIKFSLIINNQKSAWTVALISDPQSKVQSFSSVFGYARLRNAQKMTPHKKYKPTKNEDSR